MLTFNARTHFNNSQKKIAIWGDDSLLKTELYKHLTEFCTVDFSNHHKIISVTLNNRSFDLNLYLSYPDNVMLSCHGIILCYDISDRLSFENIKSHWIPKIKKNPVREDLSVLLIGLKGKQPRAVDFAIGQSYAADLGILFLECSANENVEAKNTLIPLLRGICSTKNYAEFYNLSDTFNLRNKAVSSYEMPNIIKFVNSEPEITTLILSQNEIDHTGLKDICDLNNVSRLLIDGNQLGNEGAEYIAQMNLCYLDISHNQIANGGLEVISRIATLRILALASNCFTSQGMMPLTALRNLVRLYLDSNDIRIDGIRYIASLSSLEILSLSNCNLTDEAGPYLRQMQSLTNLNISTNQCLTAKMIGDISQLSQLRTLDISNMPLGNNAIFPLVDIPSLRKLTAENINMDDQGLYELSTSYSLTCVHLDKNPVSEDANRVMDRALQCNSNLKPNYSETQAVVRAYVICQGASQPNSILHRLPFEVLNLILTFAMQEIQRPQASVTNMHLLMYHNMLISKAQKKLQWDTKLKSGSRTYRIFRPGPGSTAHIRQMCPSETGRFANKPVIRRTFHF